MSLVSEKVAKNLRKELEKGRTARLRRATITLRVAEGLAPRLREYFRRKRASQS